MSWLPIMMLINVANACNANIILMITILTNYVTYKFDIIFVIVIIIAS